jgi:hypothetical protein
MLLSSFSCNKNFFLYSSLQYFHLSIAKPAFYDSIKFEILNFGLCDLPFDLAQGGELVEPFGTCDLLIADTRHSWPRPVFV